MPVFIKWLIAIISIVGIILTLTAFIQNKKDKWSNTSFPYNLLNSIGSFLLAISAIYGIIDNGMKIDEDLVRNTGFLLLNFIWFFFSTIGIFKSKS